MKKRNRILSLWLALLMLLAMVPAAYAADDSIYELNPDFGTYLGVNRDGVHEFEITVPSDESSSTRHNPILPGPYYSYHETVQESSSNVIGFNALGFRGMKSGTATVEYYVRPSRGPGADDPYRLFVIAYVTVVPPSEFDPSVNVGFDNVRPGDSSSSDSSSPSGTPDTPVDLPTAATPEQEYEAGQIIGGRADCKHDFDSSDQGRTYIPANCTGYGYIFWPCRNCSAYKVGATLNPTPHRYVNGVCEKCGEPDPSAPGTPSTSTAGSDIKPSNSFGTYIGKNKDGVDEFRITLTAGTRETKLPMTSTESYHVNTLSSNPKVISWDGLTIVANAPGTSTLTYKYVIDGQEVLKAIVYATVEAASASTAGSDIKPDTSFGTYTGTNADGVAEFKLTLTAGTKETRLPMTSTQSYHVNTLSSNPKVISWDGLTILANAPGTSTLTYKYVIDGQEVLKAIVYATVEAAPASAVTGSGMAYSKRGTFLLPRADGGCDLVWISGATGTPQTKITTYDASFHEVSSQPIQQELTTLKGAYCGEKYNFIVFTQLNNEETDGKEVMRVVKFSKDWKRLGSASLYGKASNTTEAVRSTNLSFAEAGDMLYVHTAHKMYSSATDGLQHQANMNFSIRQSDMTITDGRYYHESDSYVSHSFAQDILVDQSGTIITLDLGDAYPRAARLFRFNNKAGGDKFTGTGTFVDLKTWPGATGDNETGSDTCALAETSKGYLSLYWDTGLGANAKTSSPRSLYLAFNPKDNFTKTQTRTVVSGSSSELVRYAYLFPTSPEGGYVLWFTTASNASGANAIYQGYCATYSADGAVSGTTSLGKVPYPANGPYYDGTRIVWSNTARNESNLRNSTMQFGILEGTSFRTVDADGELAGWKKEETSTTPTTPSTGTPDSRLPFTDVPAGSYYADAVVWALAQGITNGATATTFAPNATCERGQVATFLWRAKGSPEPNLKTNPFRDVPASSPYYKAILWAYENNIITGTSATTFDPYATCTNGHVVTMLWRAEGKPAASGYSSIASSFRTDFFTDAVAWADTTGLLKDTGAAFNPDSQSPRSNIVTYLYRNLGGQNAPDTTPSTTPSTPSTTPSTPSTTPDSAAKLANGEDITDENIRAIITALKTQYPEGMRWTNDNSYQSKALSRGGYGCAGFALICSDAAFGGLPVTEKHSDFDRIRVGDMLRMNNDTHSVVVLEKKADSVIVTEGNFNNSIHWGREISRQDLEKGNFYAETRYPKQ